MLEQTANAELVVAWREAAWPVAGRRLVAFRNSANDYV